jgi:hypothetical protein
MVGSKHKKRNTTRRRNKKAMTIPEIKNSFDVIGRGTHDIIKEGGTPAEQIRKFQVMWKSVFHRPVKAEAAESYLQFKRTVAEKRSPRNTSRKLKGGSAAALSGAPLDYTLRPGIDSSYGNFPEYQSAGLKFYDTVNQEGMLQECGIKDISPRIQAGGTFGDFIHKGILSPAPQSIPASLINDAQQMLSGRPLGPSPAPYQN